MKSIIFFALFIYCSSSFSMAKDQLAHFKQQIAALKAEGASDQDIAHVATNTLQSLLEYPLLYISVEDYMSRYRALVEAGANKNVTHPKNGKTALMFAVCDGRPDIAKALLTLGVDPTIQDSQGNTALQQCPVINKAVMPEIRCLFEEAAIASRIQKLKQI